MFCQIVKNWSYRGGLYFCVFPFRGINLASAFAEFEILYLQLKKHSPAPSCNIAYLKARLADLTQYFVNIPVDSHRFLCQKIHFESAKQLRQNADILLTKPDKGAGVVILNRADYSDFPLYINYSFLPLSGVFAWIEPGKRARAVLFFKIVFPLSTDDSVSPLFV